MHIFGGRYQGQRVLKQGRAAETLLGVDVATDRPVVVKVLPAQSVTPGAEMRLQYEAAVLRQIDGAAGLAPLLDVGREDHAFYLVAPFVSGVGLDAKLRNGPLALDEALAVGRSVLSALAQVHARRVLHRGVKPGNVIVEATAPIRQATLVDFGSGYHAPRDRGLRGQPALTARYLSPEQAGLLDLDIDGPSDLYAVGILLFECLTGRPPFDGANVGEVLQQHMTVAPPELRALGLQVPRVLDEVLQRLLRKDPRERYQVVEAVLNDLTAIAEAVVGGVREPAIVVGAEDRRRTLTDPAFVGREEELRTLERCLNRARAGRSSLVLVEAESGGGKTRLLTEFARQAARAGAWVLRGQGGDQGGERPFQLLEGVAAGIATTASQDPALAEAIGARLADHGSTLAVMLPELARAFGWPSAAQAGPEAFAEARGVQALAALLDALQAAAKPIAILLDDGQWADELSQRLLKQWASEGAETASHGRRTMLVVAFRSEEVPAGHMLRRLRSPIRVNLPPFALHDVHRLAESMAGPLPKQALEVVYELSAGSPFMASAVLRGLVEAGALAVEGGQWQVDPGALRDAQSSRHAASLLAQRLNWLPEETRELLKVGAVLGSEFDAALAGNLAGPHRGSPFAALEAARARQIVWVRPDGVHYRFVHDKIRQTLLRWLGEAEKRRLHLNAARHLEQSQPERVFELAYHFDAAGESAAAFPYALRAAAKARAQHSLQSAEQHYQIALRGMRMADAETRFRVAEGLGDVLMLRGRYAEAAQLLTAAEHAAEELPKGNLAKVRVQEKLGELAFKRGDMPSAARALEKGLHLLGRRAPAAGELCWWPLVREVVVQALHTLAPRWFVARRSLDHPHRERDLLATRLYVRLAHAYWFTRGKATTLWLALRTMNLAERYPPTLELAAAYSGHAPVMTLVPWFGRAEEYALRSLKIREDAGDVWGQAQSLHFYGIALYAACRYRDCIQRCREAIRLFERTGDYWEMNMARYHLAASLYRVGELAEAAAEAQRVHQSGRELGDIQASSIALDVWAWATDGRVPENTLATELARNHHDAQTTAQVLVAEAVRLLAADRPADAVATLQQAWEIVGRAGAVNAWDAPVLPWLTTALRRQAEGLRTRTPAERERLLRQAARAGRRALQISRRFRNDLPHALRELALLAAARGKLTRAGQLFQSSLAVAASHQARHQFALTLLEQGRVGREAGWPGADRDVADAQSQLAQMQVGVEEPGKKHAAAAIAHPASLALLDRFETVLEAGRRIASALSGDTVVAEVRTAALRLLRGEECQILSIAPATGSNAPPTGNYGRYTGLVEHALRSRGPVAFSDDPNESDDVLDALAVRAALAAPIQVHGRTAACLCVTHGQISGVFSEEELRVAEFITALAGAALENAENFASLQQLTASLEQRVAQRTAELQARSRELARSNEELQQFAYVASHDLQEPLRSVTGYCQLVQRRYGAEMDPKARELLTFAVDAAQRMRRLIQDLLAYARVTTHCEEFRPADSGEILAQALANLRVACEEAAATISHDPLPVVLGDPRQLLQVFQNLIGNALKFRGPRRPEIRIGAVRENSHWQFSVRDNGIGIKQENLQRVFLLFQRLHTREEYEGTGIGLAVCQKTVHRHGGRIWAESEYGRGTTFFFTLPAAPNGEGA